MALGYLAGKAAAVPFRLKVDAALLMVLSILPDIDILVGENFHRGPTHSLITAILVFIPFFVVYRRKALPYFVALASHGFADLFVGGNVELFWPVTTTSIYLPPPFPVIKIMSAVNIAAEITLFAVAVAVLALTRDYKQFLKGKLTNLTLIIPIFSVLLPTLLSYPLEVPALLIPPHLFFLALFAVAVTLALIRIRRYLRS
jgi:membrane-bound metal-dependent hydrolase YbcI (DUF457 family)